MSPPGSQTAMGDTAKYHELSEKCGLWSKAMRADPWPCCGAQQAQGPPCLLEALCSPLRFA